MRSTVDLNSDLGESFGAWRMGDDAAMLDVVTSANLACGFHGGDPSTMLVTCRAAAERGVTVGAHPSYRDLAGFGRRAMDVPHDELHAEVLYQVSALVGLAHAAGTRVRYVKPHGALYNRIVADELQADAVALAVRDAGLPLLGLAGSAIARAADVRGVDFHAEAYADRAYLADGSLAPRSRPGAVLTDAEEVAARALRMVRDAVATGIDGGAVEAVSICVHGDTPGAVGLARAVRARLEGSGVRLEPFA